MQGPQQRTAQVILGRLFGGGLAVCGSSKILVPANVPKSTLPTASDLG